MKRKAAGPVRRTSDAVEILNPVVAPPAPRVQRIETKLAALLLEEDSNLQMAKTIYQLREKAGLSQQCVAEPAEVSISTVSRLEDADPRRGSWAQLLRLARALASLPVAVAVRSTRRVLRVPQKIGEAKRVSGPPLRKRRAPLR